MLTVSSIPSEAACNAKADSLRAAGYRILTSGPCKDGTFAIVASHLPDPLPELAPHCGSWIVLDNDGNAVREFMRADRHLAERVDLARFVVVPADDYLAALNGPHGVPTLVWQVLHMDWPEDRPCTLADAARALDSVAMDDACERFREGRATPADYRLLWDDNERAARPCPDLRAHLAPLLGEAA